MKCYVDSVRKSTTKIDGVYATSTQLFPGKQLPFNTLYEHQLELVSMEMRYIIDVLVQTPVAGPLL